MSLFGGIGAALGALNPVGMIGTGLALGGDIYSAYSQSQSVKDTNAANQSIAAAANLNSAQQAQAQMNFQERMSDTMYSRAATDMKAAGLNPLLAAGAPASSPSGAQGSVTAPTMLPVPSVVANSISGARDLISTYAQLKTSIAQADLAKAQTAKAGVDTTLASKQVNEGSLMSTIFGYLNRALSYGASTAKSLTGGVRPWSKGDNELYLDSTGPSSGVGQ